MLKRLLAAAFAVLTACPAPADEAKPNVLFIAIDDLNDWIGCLGGHPQALTPNMDRLAARGVLFTNAHCAAPACNPSRAAVFSGLMPDKTGIWSNGSGAITKLKPKLTYLPKAFSKAGYRTLGTGKLMHRSAAKLFDDYFSTEQRWSPLIKKAVQYTDAELPSKGSANPKQVAIHNGREFVLPLNRMPSDRNPTKRDGESFDWGPWDVPDAEFGDTKITDWAIGQIEGAGGDRPLFLGVGYYRPHIPLWAPARYFERFEDDPGRLPPFEEDDLDDIPKVGQRWAIEAVTAGRHDTTVKHGEWRAAVEAYLACTTYVDAEIGRLLDALDRSELAASTLVVLWSDHGWHLGEKQHWGKWTGWERSTKVPLIIVPPKDRAEDFAKGGARCGQPVGLIDLYPTLGELCGVESPEGLDGESLVPLLQSPTSKTGRRLLTTFDQGNLSIRTEQHRYIRYADGSEELYDLIADPNEWTNLAGNGDHQEIKAQMKK